MHKKELWLKIKSYHFDHIVEPGLWERITASFGHDHPSLKAFAGKIARKHGWKQGFALQALEEYKKFIYLGIVSDFEVTPSKVIDTVWHEHLLFSKAYRQFCQEIAGRPLDHHPELVPMEEQTGRYSAQYVDTIALYKKEFGLEPPASLWGDAKFNGALQQQVYESRKKRGDGSTDLYSAEAPLYSHFENAAAADYPEFSGYEEGDGGGAGADGSWGDSSGDSGGDAGSDGGGGCSSGCGGGGD